MLGKEILSSALLSGMGWIVNVGTHTDVINNFIYYGRFDMYNMGAIKPFGGAEEVSYLFTIWRDGKFLGLRNYAPSGALYWREGMDCFVSETDDRIQQLITPSDLGKTITIYLKLSE